MTKTISAFFTIIYCSLFITACGRSHEPNTSTTHLATVLNTKVCYLLNCAEVTPTSAIYDNNKDYVYPDHHKFSNPSLREQYRSPIGFLDLKSQSLRIKVATDFMLSEFVQAEKGRYGIILPVTVHNAQAIRDAIGSPITITSGYRSPGYNARVDGSATWSRHMYGDALDMQHQSLKNLKTECIRKNASFVLVYNTHVHCDWREVDLERAFYPPPQAPDVSPTFAVLQKRLSARMTIVNNHRQLTVMLPEDLEIEGELVYRWQIRTPKNELLYFSTPQVEISEAHPQGLYKIAVTVGETLQTTTSLKL